MNGKYSDDDQLHVLVILPIERQGAWLDACMLCGDGRDIILSQVASAHEAVAVLRQQSYDLIAIWHEGRGNEVLATWEQLCELASMDGFIALGMHVPEGWHERLIAAGAIACLDMDQTDPMTLVHAMRTAIELEELREERRVWQRERMAIKSRESRDIDRVLMGQRQLLDRLDHLGAGPVSPPEEDREGAASTTLLTTADELAERYGEHYFNTLRNYVFDESQSSAALAILAEHFAQLGVTSSGLMRLHLAAVTELTASGGAGSVRHCLAGADRFVLELFLRLFDRLSDELHEIGAVSAGPMTAESPLAAA